MYNIKLDENNYYTGIYAKIGKVDGGIDIESLPPTENAEAYKWTEKITYETDENGDDVLDDDGNKIISSSTYEWVLDETKVTEITATALEALKIEKKESISTACKEEIENGFDVTYNNVTSHYDMTTDDQINITNISNQIFAGATQVMYHASGNNLCRVYEAAEFMMVAYQAEYYKTYNLTLCNHLFNQVNACSTEDEINAITYSEDSLTADIKTNFDALMAALKSTLDANVLSIE